MSHFDEQQTVINCQSYSKSDTTLNKHGKCFLATILSKTRNLLLLTFISQHKYFQ